MSINLIMDGTTYENASAISVGGKTINLSEVASSYPFQLQSYTWSSQTNVGDSDGHFEFTPRLTDPSVIIARAQTGGLATKEIPDWVYLGDIGYTNHSTATTRPGRKVDHSYIRGEANIYGHSLATNVGYDDDTNTLSWTFVSYGSYGATYIPAGVVYDIVEIKW